MNKEYESIVFGVLLGKPW